MIFTSCSNLTFGCEELIALHNKNRSALKTFINFMLRWLWVPWCLLFWPVSLKTIGIFCCFWTNYFCFANPKESQIIQHKKGWMYLRSDSNCDAGVVSRVGRGIQVQGHAQSIRDAPPPLHNRPVNAQHVQYPYCTMLYVSSGQYDLQ